MQGKGLIQFFFYLMVAVVLYQLFLVVPTNRIENWADGEAMNRATEMQAVNGLDADVIKPRIYSDLIDSLSDKEAFNFLGISRSYEDLKRSQLNLGLDLKGGMSVTMQVNLKDLVKKLAKSEDPAIKEALDAAEKRMGATGGDFIQIFGEEFARIAPGQKLAPIFIRNETMQELINFESSNAEVLSELRTLSSETVKLTYNRLKERIDRFGVVQPNVTLDERTDRILVELPGVDNPERARDFLTATAKLEFYNIYRASDPGVISKLEQANEIFKKQEEATKNTTTPKDTNKVEDPTTPPDSVNLNTPDPLQNLGPIRKILEITPATVQSAVLGTVDKDDRKKLMSYLTDPAVARLFPKSEMQFFFSQKPFVNEQTGASRYSLYLIKKEKADGGALLEGDHITDARGDLGQDGQGFVVSIKMNQKGASTWGQMTKRAAADNNREIAIVLDSMVVSAPTVNEPILNGNSQISGNFTAQEATDLANKLEVGKLPADAQIISEALVGPSLGADNIRNSLISLLVGFALVLLFMMLYYGKAGIVSIICLFFNLFFIFGSLASFGTVLTLPGIAGIVLTIGMAVDANVIIYERVREELREGKSMLQSIKDGFKYSYSAIIDANVTTFVVAFILFYFGLGPIKGFATVLMIGVLCSLFTAVLVGRLLIDWYQAGEDREMSFYTGWSKNMFSNLNIDWLGKRKMAYMISGAIILMGLISMFTRGFELGVDFKGGYSYLVEFQETPDQNKVRAALTGPLEGEPTVKSFGSDKVLDITTSFKIDETGKEVDLLVKQKIQEGLATVIPGLELNSFKDPNSKAAAKIIGSNKIGPTIAEDIKSSSVWSTIFALLFIFLYIFIRFRKWQFSLGAIAALVHDVLIVLSLFSIFKGILPFSLEIDQNFIAALLTVIGYSINDTVVVFDRIREFFNSYSSDSKEELINKAVNNTFSRTIITSMTTLFVVLILFLFGAGQIQGFAFALLIGILVGTYSSVFIATPVMSDFLGELEQEKPKRRSAKRVKA